MEVSLAGRTAVITGGSKGIGLAIATRFAASGADVAVIARGRGALDEAGKTIGAGAKGKVAAIAGDVGVAADIKRAYDEAMTAFGKIDIIVNNAGTSRTGAFEDITDEIWRDDFDQKLFAAIRLTRLVWPQMKERRWGRVINTLNIGAKAPRARSAPTSITRAAGVDPSDHEVNIKILLDQVVAPGDLTEKQRNELLASMTEEVGKLVLVDNYEQNHALANAAIQAPQLLHVHEDWIRRLEKRKLLDRALEALPSRKVVAGRHERGEGLTVPELSVLLAYTKIVLSADLLATDLADDPFLRVDLFSYFPAQMRQTFRDRMEAHPLRREIIVTSVVNDLINGAGMTFYPRLSEETGASAEELVRANFVAREIFGSRALIDEINSYDNQVDAAVQTRMRLEMRTLVERVSRWLINNRRPPLDSDATVDFFGVVAQRVVAALPELLTGREREAFLSRKEALVSQGVPEELAVQVAVLPPASVVLNVVETAKRDERDPLEVARVHFALGERLGLSALLASILALPRDDRWQTMARAALRDDLHSVHASLTAQVLSRTSPDQPAPARIADWEEGDSVVVSRAVGTLLEICGDDHADLARLSVGRRVVRTLLAKP